MPVIKTGNSSLAKTHRICKTVCCEPEALFGRVESITNSGSTPSDFTFKFDLDDGTGRKVRTTNSTGITIEEVLSSDGNVLAVIRLVHDSADDADKRYLITTSRYNDRGLLTHQSRPFYLTGAAGRYNAQPPIPDGVDDDEAETDFRRWASYTRYDVETDRVVSVQDSTGGITTYFYDDEGGVFATTDPYGVTSHRSSDPDSGRLLETYTTVTNSDLRTNYLRYEYDGEGHQVAQIQVLSDGTEIYLSQTGYNDDGFVVWQESVSGPREYHAYNSRGRRVLTWRQVSEPGVTPVVTLVDRISTDFELPAPTTDGGPTGEQAAAAALPFQTTFEVQTVDDLDLVYDDSNFELLVDLLAAYDQWQVDLADGQNPDPVEGVVQQSRVATYTNLRGQVVGTERTVIGTDGVQRTFGSRTVYDSEGRVILQTDEYLPSDENQIATNPEDITGTRTTYYPVGHVDEGRVQKTERIRGLDISFDRGEYGFISTLEQSSNILVDSYSTTTYDVAGRVAYTINFSTDTADENLGLKTTYFYNLNGQTTKTITQSWGVDSAQQVDNISYTVYDDQDRAYLQTDSFVDGDIIYATRTIYDPDTGQSIGSDRLKDVTIVFGTQFDPNQTIATSEGELLTSNRSVYDLGRVVKSISADGQVTQYEFDDLGRQVATIGAVVVIGGQEVRHRTETVYDERGRVVAQRSNIIHDDTGDGNHNYDNVQETRYEFDSSGNVTRTTFDDDSYTLVRYDNLGQRVAESQQVAAGSVLQWNETEQIYESYNSETDLWEPVPTRSSEYDNQGRLVAVVLPLIADAGDSDGDGDQTELVRPRYEYEYDPRGSQTVVRDPLGHETRFEFDEFGRQTSRTLPLGFGVDGLQGIDGDPDSVPFAEYFFYDDRGRQALHISFEGVATESIFDDITGRLISTNYYDNVDGESTTSYQDFVDDTHTVLETRSYGFDDNGRRNVVTHTVGGDSRNETTSFTDQGQIESVSSPEGTRFYEYNDLGRQIRVSFNGSDFNNGGVSDNYENVTEFSYDALGRLATVTAVERNDALVPVDDQDTAYSYDLTGSLDRTEYSNGLIHDYEYDELNRLTDLIHWVDEDGDGVLDLDPFDTERRATFEYGLRADGKRETAEEHFYDADGNQVSGNFFTYTYDALGRLIGEELSSFEDLDYIDSFVYDLVGNRATTARDWQDSGGDYETSYTYDANDRLQTETKTIEEGFLGGTSVETTNYVYDQTQQTSKTVNVDGTVTTVQAFEYNLQGRLASVTNDKLASNGDVTSTTTTTYEYDSSGNRVAVTNSVDADGDGPQTPVENRTEYLTDTQNHTGYSQVLKETEFDEAGNATKEIVYTIGHDQISQTVTEDGVEVTHHFGSDGHGSVRVLYDLAAAIVNDANKQQLFHFDAYGNLLNFADGETPLTSYLYSGEAFDFNIGQQYLRARFYDPLTGRFNRLDPFAGNQNDPQSFHKYAYVHGDPIQGIDPTGKFFGFLATFTIRTAGYGALTGGVLGALTSGADEYFRTGKIDKAIVAGVFGGIIGAGLGAVTGGFAGALSKLTVTQAATLLRLSFYGNLAGTVYGVATAETRAQAGFRGALGIFSSISSVFGLKLLQAQRDKIYTTIKRLGWNNEQAKFDVRQAIGGIRIEKFFGRTAKPSTTDGYDLLVGTRKVELKGPFLTDKLEPLTRSPQQLANDLNKGIRKNTAADEFVVDTLGLSDADAELLESLVETLGKKVTFIRNR